MYSSQIKPENLHRLQVVHNDAFEYILLEEKTCGITQKMEKVNLTLN